MIVTHYNYDQIWLDTITTTIGIIAQIMLILRFREQWILWFILDVLCVVLWAIDGNWCLSMQYVFWIINCIYGFICWNPKNN
jgi:nicotinamide mononucleotide transporter